MEDGTAAEIKAAMAVMEARVLLPLDDSGLFVSYAGIPTSVTALEYPFAYRRVSGVDFAGSAPMYRSQVVQDPRTYHFECLLLIGEFDDKRIADLEAEADLWIERYRAAYLQNLQIDGVCQWALPYRIHKVVDSFLGVKSYGIIAYVDVYTEPLVLMQP